MALVRYQGNADALKARYFPNMNAAPVFSNGPLRRGRDAVVSVNTPGWGNLTQQQRDDLPWHNHTYLFEEWNFRPGRVSGKNGPTSQLAYVGQCFAPDGLTWSNGFPAYGDYSFPSDDSKTKALGKLQKKVSRAAVNLAQSYAERKQTASLISTSVRRVVQLALWIKKGDFKSIHKRYGLPKPVKSMWGGYVVPEYRRESKLYSVAFDEQGNPLARPRKIRKTIYTDRKRPKQQFSFGDVWLEYQYGWKPLLADIYGAAETMANLHVDPPPLRITAMASATRQAQGVDFARYLVNGAEYLAEIDYTCSGKTRYILEVAEDSKVLQSLQTVGLTNPLLLAWEILPYSFVADWFFPLGNYLQQLEYARGLTFVRGSEATSFSAVGLVSSRNAGAVPGYSHGDQFVDPKIDIVQRYKTRVILGSFPYQKFPRFKPKLGVERALSGIALLNQIFSRGKTTVRT